MIAEGYGDRRTPERRIRGMENGWRIRSCWKPMLTQRKYAAVIALMIWRISKSQSFLCAERSDDARSAV